MESNTTIKVMKTIALVLLIIVGIFAFVIGLSELMFSTYNENARIFVHIVKDTSMLMSGIVTIVYATKTLTRE